MANGPTTTWQRIRSLLSARSASAASNAQLLARYAAERDEDAFTELVRRHGPMVYGVCRRVLVHAHDAEDAYQATFVILSHKADSLRKADSLSCWLHGVALRVSLGLKRNLRRRKDQSPLPADVPREESDDVSWREVRCLLDEELARLPESLRQPLILCYLEGKTRDEAAEQLGWSLSTFRGRLERGRDRLRWRLQKRGVALSAALLATLAAHKADAAISFTTSTASAQAVTLATEVMRTMFLSKAKMAALWCLVVLFLSVAVGGTAYRCVAVEPPAPEPGAPPVATKPPTPPEQDGVVKDYQAHLDSFHLGLTLQPVLMATLDDRFPFRSIQLRADNTQYTPFKRTSDVHAQITKEQAAKIIAVLAKDNFFRESVAEPDRLPKPKGNYVEIWAGYRQDRQTGPTLRWRTLDWDEHMVKQLEAIRQCVDGDAAKLLDQLLKALAEQRDREPKSPLMTINAVEDVDKLMVGSIRPDLQLEPAQRFALDGVLPFAAWPKELTDEQMKVRDSGLKLAKTWLEKQTVEFHATSAPHVGDGIRYTNGPTKVGQQWKGQTPSELYAKDAFHINVLLIQEGYSPFVRSPQSPWDKKTLACYKSAEQYAALHQKGIWKVPKFAERLKKIAEEVAVPEAAIEEMLKKDAVATHIQKEIEALEVKLHVYRERLLHPEKDAVYQQLQAELENARKSLAKHRAELLGSLRNPKESQAPR